MEAQPSRTTAEQQAHDYKQNLVALGHQHDLIPTADNLAQRAAKADLRDYLLAHEFDIVWGMNDFGCLTGVFTATIGRPPEKE